MIIGHVQRRAHRNVDNNLTVQTHYSMLRGHLKPASLELLHVVSRTVANMVLQVMHIDDVVCRL